MKHRAMAYVRLHSPAIFAAILVGCLMISSQLLFRVWVGVKYRGIAPILSPVSQDDAWYHAVMAEALEGGKPWNAILADTKQQAYPVPDVAERIMAVPGRWLHLEVDRLLLMWRFLLPALLVGVLYVVSYGLTHSRLFSTVIAVAIVCMSTVVYEPIRSLSVLLGRTEPLLYTLYDRPVHPQFEAPFLWIALFLIGGIFEAPEKKRYWLTAGLIIGLTMHTYFWAWTWCVSLLAVSIIRTIVSRRPSVCVALLKAGVVGAMVGAPVLISSVLVTKRLPDFFGYIGRLAMVFGHEPAAWIYNAPIILGLLVLYRYRQYAAERLWFVAVMGLSATFLAVNQQLITGVHFQPDHYLSLIGSSLVLWVFGWVGWLRVRQRQGVVQWCGIALLIVSVGCQFVFQYRIFLSNRTMMRSVQSFADVANWLQAHTTREMVVFSNQDIGLLISTYTSANLWWHYYAMATPVDSARIEQAAFTWFELYNLSPVQLEQAFHRDPFGMTQFFTLSILPEQRMDFIEHALSPMVERYRLFREHVPLPEALRAHRVDYVLVDKMEDRWDPIRLGVWEKVLENQRFVLYRVLP